MAARTVEFGARIPRDLYDDFKSRFPMYGAVTWFVETSLREFLQQVDANPSLHDEVIVSVSKMLNTPSKEKLSG